jgi:arylsulfatase A-like enzyme
MLFVDFVESHPPYSGPLDGLYDPESLSTGPAFLKRPDGTSQFNTARADYYLSDERSDPAGIHVAGGHDLSSEAGWRRLRTQYLANITLLDRAVGRILAALDDSGLAENTVVVFTSEHGEMGGDHAMLEKRSFYEEASRVPLLIRAPFVDGQPRTIGGNIGQVEPSADPAVTAERAGARRPAGSQPDEGYGGQRHAQRQRRVRALERRRGP